MAKHRIHSIEFKRQPHVATTDSDHDQPIFPNRAKDMTVDGVLFNRTFGEKPFGVAGMVVGATLGVTAVLRWRAPWCTPPLIRRYVERCVACLSRKGLSVCTGDSATAAADRINDGNGRRYMMVTYVLYLAGL